jgi:hypothetical protein
MNKQRKTSHILNVFQYDHATGIIGLNGVPVSGYGLYLHTDINDGSVGIDSSASINALYLLKNTTKQFEISYDTSGATKLFRLLPYQSGSFFQIGNPSNAANSNSDYVFISEAVYGNVLIGPGIGNATGNLTGATASIHKVQFNGAVFANNSIQATSFKVTGGASTGFLKADGTVDAVTYLSGNQSITVSGDATGSGTTSIALTLANTAVTPGTYGSTTLVPVVTVDSKGRITSVTTAAISGSLTFTGDVTGSGTTGTSTAMTLAASGVTAGIYTKVTVDSKGRVTVGASATTSDISEGTNLYYTDARVLSYLSANTYATQSYVNTQVSNLVAAAPATLDTLNELAAALGNDPSFATTISTALGNRLRVDINTQGLSATQQGYGRTNLGLGTAATSNTGDFVAYRTFGTAANSATGDFVAYRTFGTAANNNTGDFAAASHTHSIANVTGLQTALDGKQASGSYAASSHSHIISDVTGLQTALDGKQASLGFTPYNSTNPSGYITSAALSSYVPTSGYAFGTAFTLGTMYVGTGEQFTPSFLLGVYSNGYAYKFPVAGIQSWLGLGSLAYSSATIPTNNNQLTNGAGYITGYTETDTLATVTGRGATTSNPITINGGGAQPLTLTTANGSPWHLALVRNDLGLTSRVFAHNSPYNGWYFEHNISIAGNTNIHSGNYTSYSPSLTGSGASGTWGISISGNASTATTASNLAANTSPTIQVLNFTGVGTNSGNANQSYAIYQEGGSWAPPFPDLCIGYHTGIKLGAYFGYNGIRFFNNSDFATQTFSVNDGDNHVRVAYNLYVGGTISGSNLSGTNTGDQTNISGNAGSVSGLTLTSSANGINPDSVTQNQLGYNTSVSLFGQTDGGLYSSAYSSAWIHQIYGDFRTGQIAIRGKNNGTWQAWRTVLDSSNYSSYALPLSGGTMTGTITITSTDIRSNATSGWTGDPGAQGKIQYHANRWYIVADSGSDRIVQFRRNGTDVSYIDNSGNFIGNASTATSATTATTATNALGIGLDGNSISGMGPISNWDSRPGVGFAGYGINNHTGVTISGYGGYGGVRLYSSGYPTHASSVLRLEASDSVKTYGILYNDTSVRAPIYYDSDDTAYYLNPAGGSRLRNLYVGDSGDDWSDPGGWGTQIRFSNGPHVRFVLHARTPGIEAGMYVHTPGSVYIGSMTSHDVSLMFGGTRKMGFNASYIYTDVYLQAAGSVRAPLFYDSEDTAYYLDPNGTSNLNKLSGQTMAYNDMNPMSANSPYVARYNGSAGYRNGTMGSGQTDFNTIFSNWGSGFIDSWSSPGNAPGGSSHYVGLQGLHYSELNTNTVYGFQMACAGEADNRYFWRNSWPTKRSWVEMWHSGNYTPGTYGTLSCDLLNTGNTINIGYTRNNESIATSAFRGIEFHNPGNRDYYIGKDAGAWTKPLAINFYTGIEIRSHQSYGGTRFHNIAVGLVGSFNDGDNHFRGYYDIIAYASDRRLKHNIQPIKNALSKVNSLTGMTYQWNDLGSQHGWSPDMETREAGVFAQDVQAVLPEAVKLAPFDNNMGVSKSGENFLTVKYEKIVPLLIEAIKEQQLQIEELKNKLDNVLSSR